MKVSELKKGYWVCCGDNFVKCYNTVEEAKEHINYQHENYPIDKRNWSIIYIKDYEFVKNL